LLVAVGSGKTGLSALNRDTEPGGSSAADSAVRG
jgi:hypothetical protein